MQYNISYVSANCNPTPTIADWGRNNLICYGSCNSVLVYDPQYGSGGRVTHTLNKHTKRVNSVRWLRGLNVKKEVEIVSGSTDSLAIVWNLENGTSFSLKGHDLNVNIVDGLYKGNNYENTVVVTASMDCTVKIWQRKQINDEFNLAQTLNLGYNICTALRLYNFTKDYKELIVAVASDDSKVQIYLETNDNNFKHTVDLQGHNDWVRGLDFTTTNDDLLLATSSQDHTISLWRFTLRTEKTESIFQRKFDNYTVYLESVLLSHEGWVYSVCWHPNKLQLLSASIDKSMILWSNDEESDLWVEEARLGEIGGNTLGFYGATFNWNGDHVMGHSYNGAFHIWKQNTNNNWLPQVTVGGHFREVCDLAWEPVNGEFLVSVSADQTTRIHAPWSRNVEKETWHEIARPQVHGYDFNSLAVISRYKFATAAEEKIIRTFQAPRNFVENFHRLCRIENDSEGDELVKTSQWEAKGASVPSLGLSNKAIFSDDNIEQAQCVDKKNPYPEETHFVATKLDEPPTEETLLENTLWPEIQKLYGHGYEVFALAASPDGKFLASACKSTASLSKHAAILLWDTTTWKNIQTLESHTLTVVQMQFSPDSNHLLSVSRDRRWSLFTKESTNEFKLTSCTEKQTAFHKRIIWCCSWTHDSKYFLTGSRDCKVCAWKMVKNKCEPMVDALTLNYSVNALSFAPNFLTNNTYLFGCGLENGVILLYKWNTIEWIEALKLDGNFSHHLTVNRLAFRPIFQTDKKLQLASCSSDHSVRIYDIFLDEL